MESTDTGLNLKQKIESLTNIPIARQKILIKGGKLNDDTLVTSLNLNPKQPVMVLGTPDKQLPSKPVEKQVFLEDLNQNQLVKVSDSPSGLVNLGNTCYLNSSLQALFQIKDIANKLKTFSNSSESLSIAVKAVFNQMQKKHENVNPTILLTIFRQVYPQFAEQDRGFYKQQDAEEAFSQILLSLNKSLNTEDYFKLSFKVNSKSLSDSDQSTTYEDASKLNCHIDIKTNFLRDGILSGLKETITKYNSNLQVDTDYEILRLITRLPKYLVVHFVRFFWRRDTQKKSKILRKVQFPFELDLAEMLDPSIKQEKIAIRDKLDQIDKDNFEMIRDFKKSKKDANLTPLEQQEEEDLKIESIKTKYHDDFQGIVPINIDETTENPSSVYNLNAIITHAGSSADSGHYQAYVKDDSDLLGERWWKFNDNKVSVVNKEKIETLSGGGESDSALILIYKGKGL